MLFAPESKTESYEILNWVDPFTDNICTNRAGLPQGCIATQLYNFSFRCGSAGSVDLIDLYAYSRAGKKFGARREADHLVLSGGQRRVLISHLATDCYGKGLSLADLNRCLVSADQYRIDQIWITLPPGRAPLPDEARLTTKVIGDDCGNGTFCTPRNKCSAGGGCIPNGSVDCGNGRSCNPGSKCSLGGGCIPINSIDCGSGRYCQNGMLCGADNNCQKPPPPPGPPVLPHEESWLFRPLPFVQGGAGVLFAILVVAWLKAWIAAKVPPQWKLAAFLATATGEGLMSFMVGINFSEPAIIDLIKLNVPIGVTVAIGFIISPSHA